MHLDARHLAARERRLEDVVQPGRRDADEDDLVLEHRGVDVRLLARQDLLFRVEQVEERVARVRPTLHVGEQRRATEIDESPLVGLDAVRGAHRAHLHGHRRRAEVQRVAPGTNRRRVELHRLQGRGQSERRQRVRADAHERHGVPQRTVGVEHEQVVSEASHGIGQRRERREDHLPLGHERRVECEAGIGHHRRAVGRFAFVGGVGQHDDVARLLHRVDERLVGLGARHGVATEGEPFAGIGFGEADVIGDDLRRRPLQEVDEHRVHGARPRPPPRIRLQVPEGVFVDLDQRQIAARRLRPGGAGEAPVVGAELDRLERIDAAGRLSRKHQREPQHEGACAQPQYQPCYRLAHAACLSGADAPRCRTPALRRRRRWMGTRDARLPQSASTQCPFDLACDGRGTSGPHCTARRTRPPAASRRGPSRGA